MVTFQWIGENSYLINNYDIANLFKNNLFDLIVIKIDYTLLLNFYVKMIEMKKIIIIY